MESDDPQLRSWNILLLAAAYYVLGRLGLLLAVPPGYATLIWPPSGVALAALVIYGPRLWPGIFLGSLLVNLHISGAFSLGAGLPLGKILIALGIAAGSTIQIVLARELLHRTVGIPIALHGWRDVVRLLAVAGPFGCLVAPSIGVATMFGFGAIEASALWSNWLTWWKGDTFGVLVFLPLVLVTPLGESTVRWREQPFGVLSAAALCALLVPLGLTFYAWKAIVHFTYEKQAAQFGALAEEAETALLYRIESYKQALLGGAGFFLGSEYVSRSEWHHYVQAVDVSHNYPGMNGLGWIEPVADADLQAFIGRMRREGAPDFTISPSTAVSDNFIISYIEPLAANRQALGLNIAFEANRLAAASLARDSGEATITRKIQLVQDSHNGAGFLLMLPIYDVAAGPLNDVEARRAAFRGWIYTPLIGRAFLNGLTNSLGKTLNLAVYDQEEAPEQLIFISSKTTDAAPVFQVRKPLDVGQQQWQLVWQSTPAFERLATTYEPLLVLAGGLLLTALFGGFLLLIVRRTEIVQQLVRDRTRQLQESQEALKSSEATFRSAMEHAPIGMALVAPSGMLLKVNQSLCNLLGYQAEQLQARDFQSITHPDDLQADLALLHQTLAGERQNYQIEKRYRHHDGQLIWAQLSVSLVRTPDGLPQYFISQIQDITQRREMDRMKSEFISTVSHELRTPLTSIRGSLGLIAAGALGELPAKIKSMITIAHTNSERLVRIINDILDIEKIESGRLELYVRSVPLAPFLRQALEANEAYGQKFNVRYVLQQVPEDVEVLADQDRLMQVMANLLSNAAKFSPQGGEVAVRALPENAKVRIEVQDQGMGIPEEFRGRIFEKFAQADSSSSRRFEGTGLGLSITRQLVQAMGGTISFTTRAAEGTTFHFDLPIAPAGAQRSGSWADAEMRVLICGDTPMGADGQQRTPRVLHVEDDVDLSDVIEAALHGKAQVVTSASLDAARKMLKEEKFSLIVLDLTLPDGNGLSLLDQIGGEHAVPVVILSASEVSREVQQRVSAALVKSRTSEARVTEIILSLLGKRSTPAKKDRAAALER